MKKLFVISGLLLLSLLTQAQVKLPALVRDSMILQRDVPVNIWGSAAAREKIRIRFNNRTYNTRADGDGKWQLMLPATKAGGPYTIDISASNRITLKDVLFGDVWFCSGQSNMVHQLNIHDITYAQEIAGANYPQIRQFWVPTRPRLTGPSTDLPQGYWAPAVGEAVRPFSAVAYFFAKEIHERYHIPVGIINASVGGSPIQAWISEEGLQSFPSIISVLDKNKDTAYVNGRNRQAAREAAKAVIPPDAGLTGNIKWFDPAYTPVGWHNINIPGYWEDQGIRDLDGTVWYRREIELPASWSDQVAGLFMGRIVDADEIYINGQLVGRTTYLYPQRRYKIPAGLLRQGKNILVIRVTNYNGKGGFVPDKPYCLFAGKDTVDLKGHWQYKVGSVFQPATTVTEGISLQNQPAALFNGMVAGAIPYRIRGICWYQGESDTGQPAAYPRLMPALIYDWRAKWKENTLPFLYVQLPGFMEYNYQPVESNWALFRESQASALAVPHTAMAVAIDLGEWNDIHPDNKKDVGLRLALAAKKTVYGEDIVCSGPLYQSAQINDSRIIISFNHTGSGLITSDGGAPAEFAIAGEDKKFVWAQTKIEGDRVVVWNDAVPHPKYVRYAWADNPVNPNLYNKEGLPASPFRTDGNFRMTDGRP